MMTTPMSDCCWGAKGWGGGGVLSTLVLFFLPTPDFSSGWGGKGDDFDDLGLVA